jgi:hypothetical protein
MKWLCLALAFPAGFCMGGLVGAVLAQLVHG